MPAIHGDEASPAPRPPAPADGHPSYSWLLQLAPAAGGAQRKGWLDGLPLWIALAVVPLAPLAFFIGAALRRDWAESAALAAGAVGMVALAALVAGVTVLILRRSRRLMLILTGAAFLALALSSGGMLAALPAIHRLQGIALEHGKQWAAAQREFALSGEQPPRAPDLARVDLEWGEDELRQGRYSPATAHFDKALDDDTSSVDVDLRSHRDSYLAYRGWVNSNATDIPYRAAVTFFEHYQQRPECDAGCRADIHALIAQSLYGRARGILDSVASGLVPTYDCSQVLPTYQDLVEHYADTPYGQQAARESAAPVEVIGTLYDFPASAPPVVYLSSRVNLTRYTFSDDYRTTVDAGTGHFSFAKVAQGTYNLSEVRANGSQWYWYDHASGNVYTIVVGPLCPLDAGGFSYA